MSARSVAAVLSVAVLAIVVVGSLGLAGAPVTGTAHPNPGTVPAASSATGASPGVTLASTSTAPAAPPTPLGAVPGSRMAAALADIRSLGVPAKDAFLPDLNANPHPSLTNGHITPLYGNGPAPYGVADFGLENVSGTITPYSLSTTSLVGTYLPYEMSGLSQDISGPDEYGVQLNAVLNNVTLLGTTGYEFWTQNVVEYSTFSHQLFFVSNIWNFSGGAFNANTLSSIGPNGTLAAPELYYGVGGPITISYPFTLNLYLNSTVLDNRDAVFFNFTASNATEFYAGSYDNVTFNSTAPGGTGTTPTPEYVADGSAYNPIGLPNDFEMVLGGPGGGSNFDVLTGGAYFGLQYWDATLGSYQTIPSAYGFGSETGETSYGINPMWGYEPGFPGVPEPNAYLSTGPSNAIGLWNVSGQGGASGSYGGYVTVSLAPSNAFMFIANGSVYSSWTTTNWSLFQWLPAFPGFVYELYPGTYTLVALQANYDPAETTFTIAANGGSPSYTTAALTLATNDLEGVYTPLWALNNSGILNISNDVAGNLYLYANQYLPIGDAPSVGARFPWFGIANDYLFPVFPGIFLSGTTTPVDVIAPPSFQTYFPTWYQPGLLRDGLPIWNDLQMLFWNDTDVTLVGAASIGGWWWSNAYFGPAVSTYNVVFWNSSFNYIEQNNFATGGNALYLYGGTDNVVDNNTFTESIPSSPNPYATVAAAYGSVGIFEADYGNASDFVQTYGGNLSYACYFDGYCDVVFNNLFDTQYPALNPYDDPYYFYVGPPTCPAFIEAATLSTACFFDDAWNVPHMPGPNIIGGPYLGGNYYWNYGNSFNPWSSLPYYDLLPDYGFGILNTGDFLPLAPVPLFTVTIAASGQPTGDLWTTYVYSTGSPSQYEGENSTVGSSVTYLLPTGSYYVEATSNTLGFAAPDVAFTVTNTSVTVAVHFATAYSVTVTESGLPSGGAWGVSFYNASGGYVNGLSGTSATLIVPNLLAGSYTVYWNSYTAGFAPIPYMGKLTVSGNTNYAVTFAALYTVEFSASGLPHGYAWVLTLVSSVEGNISWEILGTSFNLTAPGGAPYSWAVGAAGYTATQNGSGSLTVSRNATVGIVFATPATTGTLSGTVNPATATVTVDGAAVAVTSGGFSVALAPGTHAVEVTESGYYAYWTNVSVSLGVTTSITISMTPVPATPSSGSSSSGGISSTGWLLIALLAALAVVFLITTLVFLGRSKRPPAMAAYTPPAAATGMSAPPPAAPPTAAPPAETPPWSEGGSPPPGAQ